MGLSYLLFTQKREEQFSVSVELSNIYAFDKEKQARDNTQKESCRMQKSEKQHAKYVLNTGTQWSEEHKKACNGSCSGLRASSLGLLLWPHQDANVSLEIEKMSGSDVTSFFYLFRHCCLHS